MKTSTTIRPVPTRFIDFELDEHEARTLIAALEIHNDNDLLFLIAEQITQSLAAISEADAAPEAPAPKPAAVEKGGRPKYATAIPKVACQYCGRECDKRGHHRHEMSCAARPPEPDEEKYLTRDNPDAPYGANDPNGTGDAQDTLRWPDADPESVPFVAIDAPVTVPVDELLATIRGGDVLRCACRRTYATAGALQSHIIRDHGGVEPTPEEVAAADADVAPLKEPVHFPNRFEYAEQTRALKGTRL